MFQRLPGQRIVIVTNAEQTAEAEHRVRHPPMWMPLMSKEWNSHRTSVVLFAVAVVIAVLAAFVTTLDGVDTRKASNETPAATTGLARPHPPLDRAPGQPVLGNNKLPHITPGR